MTTLSEVVTLPISANGGLGLEARREPLRKGFGPSPAALVHAFEKRHPLLQTERVLDERVDDLGVQRPPMPTGPRLEGLDRIRRQLADVHVGHSIYAIDLIAEALERGKMSATDRPIDLRRD